MFMVLVSQGKSSGNRVKSAGTSTRNPPDPPFGDDAYPQTTKLDGRARTRGHKRSRRLPGSGRRPAFRKRYWISGGINLKSFPNSDPREPEELPGFVGLIPRRESLGWLAGKEK